MPVTFLDEEPATAPAPSASSGVTFLDEAPTGVTFLDDSPQPEGTVKTFLREVGTHVVPALGGLGGAAVGTVGGAAIGSVPGALIGNVSGAIAGEAGFTKLQREIIKAIYGDEGLARMDAQEAANAKAHPFASQMGSMVGEVPMMLSGGGAAKVLAKEGLKKAGTEVTELAVKKAAQEFAPKLAGSVASFAGMGGGGAASEKVKGTPGSEDVSILGETAKGAVGGLAIGGASSVLERFVPAARTYLGGIGIRAPADALVLSTANQIYDSAVHGKEFDPKKVGDEALASGPAFMLMNAIMGEHGMAGRKELGSTQERTDGNANPAEDVIGAYLESQRQGVKPVETPVAETPVVEQPDAVPTVKESLTVQNAPEATIQPVDAQTPVIAGKDTPEGKKPISQPASPAANLSAAGTQSEQANAQASGEPAIAPGASKETISSPVPSAQRDNGAVETVKAGESYGAESAAPASTPKTFEEMQSAASRVKPIAGRTVLLTHRNDGKPFVKPQKVEIVQVLDEKTVRIRRQLIGGSGSKIEDIPLDRLSEPKNVVGQRMREEYLANLSKDESRKVRADSKEFNDVLYKSGLFTTPEDVSAIEGAGSDKRRSINLSRHLQIQAQKAAELLGEPGADMRNPVELSRLLPKLKELAAQNEIEAIQYHESTAIKELKRQPVETLPAEDLPHEGLAWKDGEWHFISKDDGTATRLSDGTVEKYDRFDPVKVSGVVEKGSPAYEKAMNEFKVQRAEEIADIGKTLDAKDQFDAQRKPEDNPVKAVNPRTGETEFIGQDEGGFALVGEKQKAKESFSDKQKREAAAKAALEQTPMMFRTEETAPRSFAELTGKEQRDTILFLKRILGDNVQVRFIAEKIMTPKGQYAFGKYQNGWIDLVNGRADMKDTATHEAIHAAIDMFLRPEERTRLLDAVNGNEELLAENFIQYAKDHSGALGTVRIIADKLLRYIKAFITPRQSMGVPSDAVTKFYEDMMLGRMKNKAASKPSDTASFRTPKEEHDAKISALHEQWKNETDPVKKAEIVAKFTDLLAAEADRAKREGSEFPITDPAVPKQIEDMSIAELREKAQSLGHELRRNESREVLIKRIKNTSTEEGTRLRGLLQTILKKSGVSEGTRSETASLPLSYKQFKSSEQHRIYRAALDKNDMALIKAMDDYVMSDARWDGNKGTMGTALWDKYESMGDHESAARIADKMSDDAKGAGQGIQSLAILAEKTGKTFMVSVNKMLEKYKKTLDPETLKTIQQEYNKARAITDEAERIQAVGKVYELVAQSIPMKWYEHFSAYRYSNMLSNPRSHERNVFGNWFQTQVARPLALLGQGDVKGAAQYTAETFKALPNAIDAFMTALRDSSSRSTRWDETETAGNQIEAARLKQSLQGNPVLKSFYVIPRLLDAQDKFFSAIIAQGETHRLLQKNKGMSQQTAAELGAKLGEQYLYRDKLGADMKDKSKAFGVRWLDAVGYALEQLRKTPSIGKPAGWFVPFIRTPTNVGKLMVEFSPLGYIRNPQGGKMTSEQLGRANAGAAIMMMGGILALTGRTTGAPPKDEKERRLWYDSGRRPWSLLIGNKWVPMWYFGSFAGALALPAAVRDTWADDPTTANAAVSRKLMGIVGSMSSFYASQAPLQGVGSFIDIATGRSDFTTESSLAFTTGQFIPASGFLRWANQLVLDPVYRRGGSFEESFKKDYPFFSTQARPYLDSTEVRSPISGKVLTPAAPVVRNRLSTALPYDLGTPNAERDAVRASRNAELQYKSRNNEALDNDIRHALKGDMHPDQVISTIKQMSGATESARQERGRMMQRAKDKFKAAGIII